MAEKDKITIYLGSTLRARMENYKDTTWAQIAQKAFEVEMDLQDAQQSQSVEKALKRLNNINEMNYDLGEAEGRIWVFGASTWDQVLALGDCHPNAPDIWEPEAIDEVGQPIGYCRAERMFQSWFGMERFQKTPSRYIAGFMDGATKAAEEVVKSSRAN